MTNLDDTHHDRLPDPGHTDPGYIDPNLRAQSPYSFKAKIARIIWNYLGQPIMHLTFHDWYATRRAWLKLFGAKLAHDVRIRPSVQIEQPWNLTIGENSAIGDNVILYCLAPITLGNHCTVSQYAHLCAGTHDYTRPDMPLLRLPVNIEDESWIAADAFVGPGVTITKGCVIGARSSIFKTTEPWGIYIGNPAKRLRDRPHPDATTASPSQ